MKYITYCPSIFDFNFTIEVNLKNLEYNVKTLINRYKDYKYYFGVVKADCYGHNDITTVKTIIESGCNYLCVATLDEALIIRKEIKDIPILCLGIIDHKYIPLCIENNITITISNLDYLNSLSPNNKLKIHIKINTGMNRLGVNNKEEFNKIYQLIKEKKYILEGIYTHIYNATNEEDTLRQYKEFESITSDIDLKEIPIVHVGASEATEFYEKRPYANGCRLGISMYGLIDYNDISFKSTFSLYSEVIQINEVENGIVGYNGSYKVKEKERIAIIPIGYADGAGVVVAMHKLGCPNAVRIAGCDLWLDIIRESYTKKTFYLVGGKQDVIDDTINKLKQDFDGINILGYRNGYIKTDTEREELIRDIVDKKPDVVYIAMGSPIQEFLMADMFKVHPAIYQGLGGSFDVYTGRVKRAPLWWQKHNLEFLYRFLRQPQRYKREYYRLKFLAWMLMGKFKKKENKI